MFFTKEEIKKIRAAKITKEFLKTPEAREAMAKGAIEGLE